MEEIVVSAEALKNQGNQFAGQKEYQKALECCDHAIAKNVSKLSL